jgi:hypothetical protein
MAKELKVSVELLEKVSKSWLTDVAPGLKAAAASIDELKYTRVQFGPLFQFTWDAYSKAAEYIQARLNESVPAAEQIGNALHTASVSFDQQQSDQEQEQKLLEAAIDNPGS